MNSKGWWILGGSFFLLIVAGFFFLIALVLYFEGEDDLFESKGDLAVVEVTGPILESKEIVEQLDKVRKNENFKGMILRIDSPGGGVGASQEIYQAVKRVREKKKVIASMGGVAASGGYYIAVAADKIVANPGTITGSIGVLMDYANVEDLLKYLKVHAEMLTSGKLKDVGSPLKPLTPEDRKFLLSILENMHQQFKKVVQTERNFDSAKINELADGRVFTGEQALEVGLVDKLGNMQTAVDLAKELLKIEGEPELVYPKKEKMKLLDLLLNGDLESSFLKLIYSLRESRAMYLTKGIYL